MNINEQTLTSFYRAFAQLDPYTMASRSADGPVFGDLNFSLNGRGEMGAMSHILGDAIMSKVNSNSRFELFRVMGIPIKRRYWKYRLLAILSRIGNWLKSWIRYLIIGNFAIFGPFLSFTVLAGNGQPLSLQQTLFQPFQSIRKGPF